jgi:hypothetical protein
LAAVLPVVGTAFDQNEIPISVFLIEMNGYCCGALCLSSVAFFKLLAIALVWRMGCFTWKFFLKALEQPISIHLTKFGIL